MAGIVPSCEKPQTDTFQKSIAKKDTHQTGAEPGLVQA